jgi:uncharacterized membrane protein YeaQ/YmgE (transglycosylase-associated protein family)
MRMLGLITPSNLVAQIVVAILGAVVVVAVVRMLKKA